MRTRLAVAALIAALFVAPVRAQDPEKIIDQYIKAQGGAKNLAKAQTISIEGTFTNAADGKTGTYTFDTRLPNRYYSELVIGDQNVVEAYNGKSAWHRTTNGDITTLVGVDGTQLEAAGQYYNSHLVNAKKNKLGGAFIGHAQVNGKDALQIEVTTPAGMKREVFFDPQSHLIVKESAPIGGIDQEVFYDDYRAAGSLKLPYKIELHRGSDSYQITVTQATVNSTVGERVFDFPKKEQVQLPDLKALFKEVDDNQKAIDKIKENYAGTRNEEETEYDKTGKVTKHEQSEYSFFYLDGDEVSTLTKKDGKPLSQDEQDKENKKTQKTIEDILIFDFEPNPEFKPLKLAEKVVHELAGVIWVDEKAHDVARLEAYFVGDFRFAGGVVANLQKGTSFIFEQGYINNEVWLPTYEEAHVGVRVLLVKGFKVNAVTRYSDYKKFNVESVGAIGKPKDAADPPADPPKQ